jgi:hypothetical protein
MTPTNGSACERALPIVYLGPSLPRVAAEAVLTADYRPPIKRGDLPAYHDGPILILDGEFHQNLSVSPKELLLTLDGGTRVIGAASMGALRAVELERYGMEGYGWVFEAFRAGRIDADDEVAVSYSPYDLSCMTIPVVNVRRWLEVLASRDQLDSERAELLLRVARSRFYADRSRQKLLADWEKAIGPAELERLLRATDGDITDVKADDAVLALTSLVEHRRLEHVHQFNEVEEDSATQPAAKPERDRDPLAGVR